jgi:hypothetical protein
VEEIRAYLEQQRIPVFYGLDADTSEKLPRTYWRQELGGDWKVFLQHAQELGAKPVYLFWSEFVDLDLLELFGEEARRRYENHVGEVCMLEVAFFFNGILHSYHEVSDWYTEYEDMIGDENDALDDTLNDKPF